MDIFEAIKKGNQGRIKRLLKMGVDINTKNSVGDTVINSALKDASNKTIQFLIDNYPGIDVTIVDRQKNTPLHNALQYKRQEAAKKLIKRHDLDINAQNKDGETPVMIEVKTCKNNPEMIQYILQQRPDVDMNKKDNQHNTILHQAIGYDYDIVVQYFLKTVKKIDINAPNKDLDTPLHIAIKNAIRTHNYDLVILLIINGASVTQQNRQGKSAETILKNLGVYNQVIKRTQLKENIKEVVL